MKKIAILITVHNRKEKTLKCLQCIFHQTLIDSYEFDVYLTNDGCTDGTPEAIIVQFQGVNIIQGDGTLYWNRGMFKAWEHASAKKEYDFYLWINDDTMLYPNSLSVLLKTSLSLKNQSIVVGSANDKPESNIVTYGGRNPDGVLIEPSQFPVPCAYFNGNLVLIPKYVYHKVGKNDPKFRHALGDFDYGKRAVKLGIKSYVAPGYLGSCQLHESLPVWCNPNKPFYTRWKSFRIPLGQNPEEYFIYEYRHYGLIAAIYHYLTNHLRVFIPSLWNFKNNQN